MPPQGGKNETQTIPIVFAPVAEVQSKRHAGKWLELLIEIAPNLKRATMIINPDTAPSTMASLIRAGAMPIASAGLRRMMERLLSNGVRCIVVENASQFGRDLIVWFEMLKARGIELVAANKPDALLDIGSTATLILQVLGACPVSSGKAVLS